MLAPSHSRDGCGESMPLFLHQLDPNNGDPSTNVTYGRYFFNVIEATGSVGALNLPYPQQDALKHSREGDNIEVKSTYECRRCCIATVFACTLITLCILLLMLLLLQRGLRPQAWMELSLFGIGIWRELDTRHTEDFWSWNFFQ